MSDRYLAKVESYWCFLYVAGDIQTIERVCRQHCFQEGLCVTVEPLHYIFTGGSEIGARIGLINYARFPSSPEDILVRAEKLGWELTEQNAQWSFTIIDAYHSRFYSKQGKP